MLAVLLVEVQVEVMWELDVFKKHSPLEWELLAAKGKGEMKCILTSFLYSSKVSCQPPHLPISLFSNKKHPRRVKCKTKTCFRCKKRWSAHALYTAKERFLSLCTCTKRTQELISRDYRENLHPFIVQMLTRGNARLNPKCKYLACEWER